MTRKQVGPLELERIGDYANIGNDPDAKPPAEIQRLFPAGAEEATRSPGGTWFSTVKDNTPVIEDGREVLRSGRRLHWIAGGTLHAAKDLPGWYSLDFDEQAGIALLSADLGEILKLDLAEGTIRPIPVEGYGLTRASRLQGIHMLRGGRVLIHDVTDDGVLVIARITPTQLTVTSSFAFEGDHTIVNGRILVGGGMALSILDLSADTPVTLGHTEDLSCWMTRHTGPSQLRLYTHDAGAWDVHGLDAIR